MNVASPLEGHVGIAAKYGNILRINYIGSEILYSKAVLSLQCEKAMRSMKNCSRLLSIRSRANVEIAQRLFGCNRTVTTHLERIYRKLNIHSMAALAYYLNTIGSK
ncbi:MAG: helix-turn-helix transcriptional regulator [Clostridia bacterium]